MKKILAWVLLFVMVLGMFAGCSNKETPAPTETEGSGDEVITAQDAIEYLKALYPRSEDAMKTPVNYDRMGIIRVGGIPFTVVWTTDLPEEQIKIVVSEDGATVTMDVNEQCEADTPYVLTATITDEQGNTATATWNCLLPAAVDMVAIVKEAYALKPGESLPYVSTLRGKIVSIDTVWNPEYQNITVSIVVEGAEDMPIKCYRLKGEGADALAVGNIITVTGTLKNYSGTIEFDAGCMLDAVEQGDAVVAPTDPGEILKAAYKLKDGKSLPYPVTLTGKVTSIDSPFDPAYNNISVVLTVDGYKKYPILCYRLKGTGVEDIALEDTITVTGIIKNYKGTIEFDAGCQLIERISGGNTAQKPTDDQDKILRDAKKLKPGEKLPYIAILTGQVFSVDTPYDSEYKNITVTIKVAGTRIQCYRMTGDEVKKVKVSDTITVSGQIENYNGILEYSKPTMTDRKAGNGKLTVELGPVEEGKQYYAEMKQGTLNKNLYLNGQISGSGYLKTTENPAEAVKIFAEETKGKGTRFYFLEGETKKYIEIHSVEVSGDTKQRPAIVTEPTAYWNYDSEYKVYFMSADGVYCALGTYSNYDTVSATKLSFLSTSNMGKTQFVVKYVEEPSAAPEAPETPDVTVNYVDAPVVGTAYKFVLNQAGLGLKLGFTGKMANTYYFGTSEEIADMVDVYLEEATGGYRIYFMNGSTKTYLNIIPRDTDPTKTNVVMQTLEQNEAPSVYELNTEFKYVKTAVAGDEWYLGTYGTNRTISASQTYRIEDTTLIGVSQFVAWFATIGEVTPEEPPVDPEDPETPATSATKLTTLPENGDVIVIYNSGKAMANVTSGNKIAAVDGTVTGDALALTEDMAQLKVVVEGNNYIFMLGDKYLTSGATGNAMSFADTLTDCGRWTIEAATAGTWYIKNVGANYNGNYNQAMEYYSGFTTYGLRETEIYQMQLFKVDATPAAPTGAGKMNDLPVNDDVVVIYNSGKAMGNTASGSKIAAVDATVTDDVLTLSDEMAQLKVVVEGDKYIFMLGDKYLTSGATGNAMSFADTLTDCGRWTIEAATAGTWYIKNVGANYNGNYNQAMEYYSGFTTYGLRETEIYQMQLYKVGAAVAPEQPPVTPDQPPVTPDEPVTPPATADGILELTVDTLSLASNSYSSGTATVEGIALDYTQLGNYGDGLQMRDKNGNTSILFNTTALPGKITKIELTYSTTKDVTHSNADAVIFSFGAAQDNLTYSTKLSTVAGEKNYTITPEGEHTFFKIEHDLGFSFYWDSIKIYYEATGTNPGGGTTPDPETPPVTGADGILELTVDTLSLASNSYSSGTATVEGIALDYTQLGNYGDGLQMRDKNGNTSILFNTTALPGKITKIELTYSTTKDVTHSNADAVIFSFGAAQDNLTYSTKLSTVAGEKNYTITPEGEHTFFKIEHDLGFSFYWDSIKIYYEATGTNPGGGTTPDPETPPVTGADGVLELTVDTLGIASNTYFTGAATVEGIELDLTQIGNYGYGVQMRDKDGKTSILFNKTALPGKITKIELVFNSSKTTYNNADAVIFSFGAAQDNLTYSTKLSTVAGEKNYVITPQGDHTFFKIEHDLGFSYFWDSIKIYYEA